MIERLRRFFRVKPKLNSTNISGMVQSAMRKHRRSLADNVMANNALLDKFTLHQVYYSQAEKCGADMVIWND